jgi:hypothetical protein
VGEKPGVFFKACLKDEALSKKKAEAGKTRVFTGCPFAYQVLFRQYFLPVIAWIQEHFLEWECAVGCNPRSQDWTDIHDYIVRPVPDELGFIDGDFGAYDKRMSPQFLRAAFGILIDFARRSGYSSADCSVMWGLASDVIYANVIVKGDVVVFPAMHVSGEPATVIINSVVNSLLMRSVYFGLGVSGPFRDNVSLITYGDDNIQGVAPHIRGVYNFAALSARLERMGIEYTPADKSDARVAPFRRVQDISFLKRRWEPHPLVGWLAPLDKASIIGSLIVWVRSTSIGENEQLIATFDSALYEMLAYGELEYNEFRDTVMSVMPEDALLLCEWTIGSRIADFRTFFEKAYNL